MFIGLAIMILEIAATWTIYNKAGEEGWKSIVRFLCLYLHFQMRNI